MAASILVATLACATLQAAHAGQVSPTGKVMQLLSDLQAKIIGEGKEAQHTYAEFSEWCDDRSKNLALEMKAAKSETANLKAAIDEEDSIIESLTAKVEELAADIATDDKDLKAATEIRATEAAAFAKEEKELVEVTDALQRASRILEQEMQKGGASMLQVKNAAGIARALGALVQASSLTSADARQLVALVQGAEAGGEEAPGAPEVAAYEGHSGGILGTLADLLEKGQAQLSSLRSTEVANVHNFGMLKQSLEGEIKYAKKEMAEAKQGIAASSEKKATAEGDLEMTSRDLKEDGKALADLHQTCMTKAQDYEAELQSRGEELKALAAAKKVLTETTAGASKLSYGLAQASFLELARVELSSRADLAAFEAVRLVRDLAQKDRSPLLAQLAARMASVQRSAAQGGLDPFAKVKGLVSDMIAKLEEEAERDATHKAYCDKELAESNAKHEDHTAMIKKLTTKIDQMSSRSEHLKGEVSELQTALSELTKAQAEMDKLRQEERADYVKAKAEMEQGVEGVKMALKVLRDYYENDGKSHDAAQGAGDGIISMLELVESDFTKGLAEMTAAEEAAQASYDKETKENEIEKATKEQDVKYKSEEATKLDESVAEASSDLKGEQAELDAVKEYLASLEKQCIAKPEGFAERIERLHSEIAGLKEALKIIEGEAVLLQGSAKRVLRTPKPHRTA